MTRAERAAQAAALRAQGLSGIQIAERMGISRPYAYGLLNDPTGERDRTRKRRYDLTCVDCGARVDGTTPGRTANRDEPRCVPCAAVKKGAEKKAWTRDVLVARIREWADIYGDPPAEADWNPWQARHAYHDEERARRFEDAAGYWPTHATVFREFGSWGEGLCAAGYQPRAPHGGGDNVRRRRRRRVAA